MNKADELVRDIYKNKSTDIETIRNEVNEVLNDKIRKFDNPLAINNCFLTSFEPGKDIADLCSKCGIKTLNEIREILAMRLKAVGIDDAERIMFKSRATDRVEESREKNLLYQDTFNQSFNMIHKKTPGDADRYVVKKRIGGGGSGTTYLVKNVKTDKETVVKSIRYSSPEEEENACKEFDVLKTVDHPNIVKIIASWNDTNRQTYYYEMEYFPKGDLGTDLKRRLGFQNYFSEKDAMDIFIQGIEALKFLHYNNKTVIIHRDIKPQNLFIDNDKETGKFVLHIADFGIVKVFSEKNYKVMTICGTPMYIAPEILKAIESKQVNVVYTPNVDVFAFGCVMYELLTLSSKQPSDSYADQVQKSSFLKSVKTEIKKTYSQKIADIVARMMEKDPSKRPTASQISKELDKS